MRSSAGESGHNGLRAGIHKRIIAQNDPVDVAGRPAQVDPAGAAARRNEGTHIGILTPAILEDDIEVTKMHRTT